MHHSKSAKKKKKTLGQTENCVLYQFSTQLVQTVFKLFKKCLCFGVSKDVLRTQTLKFSKKSQYLVSKN